MANPNLTSPAQVRQLLRELGVRPNRKLGQHFLIDANILRIIVATAALQPSDEVLEVGPGLGVLTEPLLRKAARVLAVEKDSRLHAYLRERFAEAPNLELRRADVLDIALGAIVSGGIGKVVSNLPYAVGTRALLELIELPVPPRQMVVTVQQDVGERLAAPPGGKAYGALSVLAQAVYRVVRVRNVSPSCFFPKPEVTSALLHLALKPDRVTDSGEQRRFRALVKYAFQHRRKQLVSVLQRAPPSVLPGGTSVPAGLRMAGIPSRQRPEQLSSAEWQRLAQALTP